MSLAEDHAPKGLALRRPPPVQRFFGSVWVSIAIYVAVVGLIIYGSFTGAQNMGYNWQWHRVPQYLYSFTDDGFQLGEMFWGLMTTIKLSVTAFFFATLLGLLVAILRLSGLVIGSAVAVGFLEFIRNIPLLVQMFIWYFAIPELVPDDMGRWMKRDMPNPEFVTAVIALGLYTASRVAEQVRAGRIAFDGGGLALPLFPGGGGDGDRKVIKQNRCEGTVGVCRVDCGEVSRA